METFVETFRRERASAIVRTRTTDDARRAMQAAVRGGFRVCEFTLTVPGALELVTEFCRDASLTVGAGTVLTPADARAAVRAGAKFLVSPIMDESVIAESRSLGVPMMPGCATPGEMYRAHLAGAALQKLFPGVPGSGAGGPMDPGPAWIAQTLAPLPMLRIVPTANATPANAAALLKAGAWAVGFVASVFDAGDIARGDFEAIERRARAALEAVRV
ncbi:MAG: 2-dehydro-3-deoxyphosphogluconate aldolase [Phycisphaerales bacterium]|nr:2-dehydro-3-deoxyphosphogluconate aldolase [Phycisphaerales bacterium]